MLNDPNTDSPANIDASVQFKDDYDTYRKTVRRLVRTSQVQKKNQRVAKYFNTLSDIWHAINLRLMWLFRLSRMPCNVTKKDFGLMISERATEKQFEVPCGLRTL